MEDLDVHSLFISVDAQGQADDPLIVGNGELELGPHSCDQHPTLKLLVDVSVEVNALVLVVHVEDLVEVETKYTKKYFWLKESNFLVTMFLRESLATEWDSASILKLLAYLVRIFVSTFTMISSAPLTSL